MMAEQIAFPFKFRCKDDDTSGYLQGPANEEAVRWVDRWPDWPDSSLVLLGAEGAGKSSLGNFWAKKAKAFIIHGGGIGNPMVLDRNWLSRLLEGPCPIFLDSADLVHDKELLLHLINAQRSAGVSILLAMRQQPSAWAAGLPDLLSRLRSMTTVEILPPDEETLAHLILKLFADRQLDVKPRVIEYLMTRMERSYAAALSIVSALDQAALKAGGPVDQRLVRQILDS